jgi:hypothetical protein
VTVFTFRVGLSSGRPIREDRQRWITLMGEDSPAGMLAARQDAIAMAMGSLQPWEHETTMPTSTELISAEI